MLQNTELKTILTQKGYQFNEQGNLLLDDMANKTTSLDLSGTGISVDALSELSILPNLTDVDLSDNGYTKSFDFTKLPPQITGVDLTGNEIYEYPGLLSIVTQENGDEDVTVLRTLTKLYLPESAKYNCDEIPTYFAKVSGVDMQMENASGTLETYTTLREVPDEGFRAMLKKTYPSLFNGDYIDISKRLVAPDEKSQNISTVDYDAKTVAVNNVEGFQYIANNKGYDGTMYYLYTNEQTTINYFPVAKTIGYINMSNISTPNGMETGNATSFSYLVMYDNAGIETLDMSSSTIFGQRSDESSLAANIPDYVGIYNCENIKNIVFPESAKVSMEIDIIKCPSLEKLDLKQFETMYALKLGALPSDCEIIYPELKRMMSGYNDACSFAIDEDLYNRDVTKAFIENYYVNNNLIKRGTYNYKEYGVKYYNWKKNYQ